MRTTRLISAVDSHTEGMPTSGGDRRCRRAAGREHGRAPAVVHGERRRPPHPPDVRAARSRIDEWSDPAAADPSDADYGVLFIEVSGLLPMCGHGTMGVATVLVETGMVPVTEPVTTIRLEVPAGLVVAEVGVRDGHATSVTLRMVPSFSLALDQHVQVPGFGSVGYDIAYGGNFYAIVELASLGLPFDREAKGRLLDAGLAIMAAINEQNRPLTQSARTSPVAITSTSPPPARRRNTRATRWRSTPAGSTGRPVAPAPVPGWPSCTRGASCRSTRSS